MKFLIPAASLLCALSTVAAQTFTATRIYHTIIPEWPYLVDRTTLITWTAYPAPTPAPGEGPKGPRDFIAKEEN
ncbi:hypothetical protein NLJ89_g5002 [Agrocybe chaxingu]|uniref:Uncharacterized protein n=1 Tax=Agrocybe chaxingu TaxID=84603 RepID=A0A9W8K1Z5_9AGAR|nr:hypothetical protein NLJ89_g5002 [Agrocybe chaxingu]